jgi:hypothetical protein
MDEDEEVTYGDFFYANFDKFICNLARICVHRGNAAAVAVLSEGSVRLNYKGDRWKNLDDKWEVFDAWLSVPQALFLSVIDRLDDLERELLQQAQFLLRAEPGIILEKFTIEPKNVDDPDWRPKAKAWLKGKGVNNQGRVRSDNIAPYTKDGLLFRSKPEINLYDALKARGITFAPLPVFIRGGDTYRRIEPDFVIFQSGRVFVIELHGLPFHTESPVEAHERTTMFHWEGAHIEPIEASECDTPEKANRVADQIQDLIRKLLANK